MEELKGIYKKKENRLEVYYKNELIVDEKVLENEEYWVHGIIEDNVADFNLWKESEDKFNLTIYPNVIVDDSGYYSTDTYHYEPVDLIII